MYRDLLRLQGFIVLGKLPSRAELEKPPLRRIRLRCRRFRHPADLVRSAVRKLTLLDQAVSLDDLRSPPGNQLEALKRDRKGQHSIRINDQWRICFVWTAAGPEQVEIVDHH